MTSTFRAGPVEPNPEDRINRKPEDRKNEPVAYILISVLFLYVPLDVKHEQNILYFKIFNSSHCKASQTKKFITIIA